MCAKRTLSQLFAGPRLQSSSPGSLCGCSIPAIASGCRRLSGPVEMERKSVRRSMIQFLDVNIAPQGRFPKAGGLLGRQVGDGFVLIPCVALKSHHLQILDLRVWFSCPKH